MKSLLLITILLASGPMMSFIHAQNNSNLSANPDISHANSTLISYVKIPNRSESFVTEKYYGNDLNVTLWILNAKKFSGTIDLANGVVWDMTQVIVDDNKTELKSYIPSSYPYGNYVVELNIINGSNTSSVYGEIRETNNNKTQHFNPPMILLPDLLKMTPLMQTKSGIYATSVICKDRLQLIIKAEDGSPACVRNAIVNALVERGWATNLGAGIIRPPELLGNPPPEPLTMWGPDDGDTLDYAKSVTGLSWALLPTYIPTNITLQGIRGEFYSDITILITAIYAPSGITASDKDTFEKVMDGGGVFVVYSHPTEQGFNLTEALANEAEEFPYMHPETIEGQQALVSNNEVQVNLGNNNMVDIISWKYHSNDLRTIVESIIDPVMQETKTQQQNLGTLELLLSTNSTVIKPRQTVTISIAVKNTSSQTTSIDYQDNWTWKRLGLQPCVDGFPFGVALLQGNYSVRNLTESKQLALYQNGGYMCPAEGYDKVDTYVFQPSSDNATLETRWGNFSSEVKYTLSISGYYGDQGFKPLVDGSYTIVAGDEWGHLVINHFTVTNSTGN